MRITLIDDSIVFSFIFQNMLKGLSDEIEINILENGIDATHYFDSIIENPSQFPDILFLDLSMPFMDGWEFLEILKTQKFPFLMQIPIYLVSSSTSKLDYQRLVDFPFIAGYLHKPFEKKQLIDIIKKELI